MNHGYGRSALHKINLSGEGIKDSKGRDFSISSLSSSSQRGDKSVTNPTGKEFKQFFEKNYFVDGE